MSKRLKLRLYEGVVKLTLMFNLWTVLLKKAQRDRVDRTHRRHLRDLVGRYYREDEPTVSRQEVHLETDTVPISVELGERRWTLLGYMLRLPANTPASRAMGAVLPRDLCGRSEARDLRLITSDLDDDHAKRRVQGSDDSEDEERSWYY